MIQSMTGFGAAEGRVGNARVSVELRTVNHRFFNPSIKLPSAYARWEGEVREALRQRIARGHVVVMVRVERDAAAAGAIDEARFAGYVEQLRGLQARHNLGGELDVATVLRMPDVFASRAGDVEEESGSASELVALVDEAARALAAMRGDEGSRLAAYLRERIGIVDDALARIAVRAPVRLIEQRDRMRNAVRELTDGIAVDEQRIAQEIALLADRMDVSEELDRFGSHVAAFRGALRDELGEPVGKRLGFVLQEMLREANTTGSKAADAEILRQVMLIKEELERIREQVENLE
jgi:uncharacterized protein (TIGR00255 family)